MVDKEILRKLRILRKQRRHCEQVKSKLCFIAYIYGEQIIMQCGSQVMYQQIDDDMRNDGNLK